MGRSRGRKRVSRSRDGLLRALLRQTRLLNEHRQRAFDQGDDAYLSEVAAVLRVLACKTRSNRPLLLDLMEEHGFPGELRFDGPGGVRVVRLRDYMGEMAYAIRGSDGAMHEASVSEFVLGWAQQLGGAHEDWALDETLHLAVTQGLYIGGRQVAVAQLRVTARNVHDVAQDFLHDLLARGVLKRKPE